MQFAPINRGPKMSFDRSEAEKLIAAARVGGKDALGQLLEHYRQYLRLLAEVGIDERFQAKVDPSDLVQETFVERNATLLTFVEQAKEN